MVINLKKLFIFILLPLAFSSCQFLTGATENGARNPQSEVEDHAEETLVVNAKNSELIVKGAAEEVAQVVGAKQVAPENLSDIEKLCSLPREFTNPVLYDQYCGNSCKAVGNSCEDHSDCCSHRCSGGVCQAGGGFFVPITQRCTEPSQCETGLCSPHPAQPYKICYGSLAKGVCEFSGEPCIQADNCCSNRCYKNKCVGAPSFPNSVGKPCYTDNNECASNQCNFTTHKCR